MTSTEQHDIHVIELVQKMVADMSSGIIEVRQHSYEGKIYIDHGKIIDAIYEELPAIQAFFK
ncbi:MAG: hypothetical protein ACFFAY_16395, partial [Promethearchaeota archaeon]